MKSFAFLAALLMVVGCAREERRADLTTTTATTTATTATAAPASMPANTDTAASAPAPEDHDVTGAYMPIDPLPGEFAELDHLLLATIDENAAPAPLNGFLRPKKQEASDYVLVKPSMEGKKLTFTTTAVGGVQYAFDGEFQLLAKFAEDPPSYETVVLSGTLQRMRDGQTIASTPVRFRYEAGG